MYKHRIDKFRYKIVDITSLIINDVAYPSIQQYLNEQGQLGWEIIHYDKREVVLKMKYDWKLGE